MPFEPLDLTVTAQHKSAFHIQSTSPERWIPIISSSCSFSSDVFEQVMLNLVRNPNLNTSWVFRADILFDSASHLEGSCHDGERGRAYSSLEDDAIHGTVQPHKDEGHGYWDMQVHGFRRTRTLVRKMISRNPQRDPALIQTCHFYSSNASPTSSGTDTARSNRNHLVVYLPHVTMPEEIPFYHPKVQAIAFLYTGSYISVQCSLFNPLGDITTRLCRTAHQLLQTLHKHGHGTAAGYVKRVHHDTMISQARVQNTYTCLKTAHAKRLLDSWVEVTDPTKHVFEDLGIAAFLIERWQDMYGPLSTCTTELESSIGFGLNENTPSKELSSERTQSFPGFVDIGCGNGVLVEILNREGWMGWGFDARRRKTWATLAVDAKDQLKEMILLPAPLLSPNIPEHEQLLKTSEPEPEQNTTPFHDGQFPPGTFLISNHADQLTGWTPILAALADYAPFIIIPCCSCDLSGARFRAPPPPSSQQATPSSSSSQLSGGAPTTKDSSSDSQPPIFAPEPHSRQQAESGTISKPTSASTYAALVAWTARIAENLGYIVEKEVLRIPSTRNVALLGHHPSHQTAAFSQRSDADGHVGVNEPPGKQGVLRKVEEILETFGVASCGGRGSGSRGSSRDGSGRNVKEAVAAEWTKQALGLRKGGVSGH